MAGERPKRDAALLSTTELVREVNRRLPTGTRLATRTAQRMLARNEIHGHRAHPRAPWEIPRSEVGRLLREKYGV